MYCIGIRLVWKRQGGTNTNIQYVYMYVFGSTLNANLRKTYECLQREADVRVMFVCVGGRERDRKKARSREREQLCGYN